MTVSKVGTGGATTATARAATQAAPATNTGGSEASAAGGSAPADNYSGGAGEETLLNPDGSSRNSWGTVNAPPEPPIHAFGNETPPKFGNIDQPAPQKDPGPGKLQQGQATTVDVPPSPPLQKTKWSIITGPPQGDG